MHWAVPKSCPRSGGAVIGGAGANGRAKALPVVAPGSRELLEREGFGGYRVVGMVIPFAFLGRLSAGGEGAVSRKVVLDVLSVRSFGLVRSCFALLTILVDARVYRVWQGRFHER